MAPCQCFYSLLSLCRIVEALIPCRRQSSFHLFSLQRYSLLRDHVLSQAALWVIEPPRNRNWSLCCLPLYGASTAALESDQAMSAQVRFSKWWTRIEQQRQVYELVILKSRTCRGPFCREQREKRTEMAMLSLPRAPEEVAAEVLRVAWWNGWPNVGTLLPKHSVKVDKFHYNMHPRRHNTVCFQPLCA